MVFMTRRRFLTVLFASMGAIGALAASSRRFLEDLLPRLKARLNNKPTLDVNSSAGLLSEGEMKTILALAQTLVPGVAMAKLDGGFFTELVNHKTSTEKGWLKEYREAVGFLNETTQNINGKAKSFAELTPAERERVLESMLWKYRKGEGTSVRNQLMEIISPRRTLAFRAFVVRHIMLAFSRSPAVWAIVGYSHYPGVPAADPFEYTRRPDAASLQG
jgi:hypothetical protein